MRKILKKIFVLMVFIIPGIVFADVGAPSSSKIDAVITAVKGADIYKQAYNKSKKEFEYNITNNKKMYGSKVKIANFDGDYACFEDYETCVLKKDIRYVMDIENMIFTEGNKFYAYEETPIYEAPTFFANEVGKIKKGKSVSTFEASGNDYYDDWRFVVVGKTYGWVYVLDGYTAEVNYDNETKEYEEITATMASIAPKNAKILIINDETYVYEKPIGNNLGETKNDSKKTLLDVKKGDEVPYLYYYDRVFGKYYYVEVNGVSGWISYNDVAVAQDIYIMFTDKTTNDARLYENFNDKNSVENTFENNKIYDVIYGWTQYGKEDEEWYLIQEGKDKKWVKLVNYCEQDCNVGINFGYIDRKVSVKENTYSYNDAGLTEKNIKIDSSKKYDMYSLYSNNKTVYYIRDIGYINPENQDYNKEKRIRGSRLMELIGEEVKQKKEVDDDDDYEYEEDVKLNDDDYLVGEENHKEKKNPVEYTKYYVGVTAVVALVAIISIIIINKKKSKKNNVEK